MLAVAPITLMDDDSTAPAKVTFEDCYQRHRKAVFHHCLRYGGGRASWAEDVTHDVFVKLLEHLPQLAEGDDLGGWLYRVTANLAISRLRREQSLLGRLHRLWGDDETAASAETLFEQQEVAASALAVLRELPARERVVVCMKLLDGKSQREIAMTLALSEGYVSKLLARGYERIRARGWEVADDHA